MRGVDFAFNPHPPAAALKAAGIGFACRYMSPMAVNDANGKNLLPGELAQLRAAGLAVVVVEESDAGRMKAGHAAGVADAQHAKAVTAALGIAAIPVYFACDFDATLGDQAAINAYLDGAASVIGRDRTGIYGGFYPLSRALDAGKADWAWQTSAWSGGQWDARAHIRQQGTLSVAGFTVDIDESMKPDFGQWPRPATAAPAPAGAYNAPRALTVDRVGHTNFVAHWQPPAGQNPETYRVYVYAVTGGMLVIVPSYHPPRTVHTTGTGDAGMGGLERHQEYVLRVVSAGPDGKSKVKPAAYAQAKFTTG